MEGPAGGRETAGLTMKLIVDYVRGQVGPAAVDRMLAIAGETRPLAALENETVWSSYDQKIALFSAAAEVTGRRDVAWSIGETVLHSTVGTSLQIALGLLGSPSMVLRSVARANAKFSTAGSMRAEDVTSTSGTVVYRVRDGFRLSHFDCDYAGGLLTQIPVLFGLPPAAIEHPACQVLGAPECVYQLRWRRRPRRLGIRRKRPSSVAADALLQRLRQLQATLSDLVATSDVEEVLDTIASRAGSAVNAERFVLAVRLREGEAPSVRSDGFTPERAGRLADDVLAGRPVTLDGYHMLSARVRTSTRSYGRLAAFAQNAFLDHEAELLESYAGLAATALEAVTSLTEAEDRRRAAEALLDLATQLHTAGGRPEIAAAVATAARTVVSADVASSLLFDENRQSLRVLGHSGWPADLVPMLPQVSVAAEDTPQLALMMADPDAPRIYRDDCEDPFLRSLLASFRTRLIAVVSLQGTSGLHGVLLAGWLEGSPVPELTDGLFENLKALSSQATNALDKAELMSQVHRQATSDPLTGIANRRVLGEQLEEAMRRPCSERRAALLFLDLDGFKQVNDTLGHRAGDDLLRVVAGRLLRSIRTDDLVARLGGDEFTVLLSSVTGPQAALEVGNQLLAALSEPIVIDQQVLDVHCSIGVVLIDPGDRSPNDILADADAAMYGAKKSGGNRCTLFDRSGLRQAV
ncbi:MAG TPA: GGDEF domain-containing protein [Acidimicrobiales bacterium]|nr:GGDEF domain-containing protein [Acidimicrobiales bacterium]